MRGRFRLPPIAIALVLLCLIGGLATLQYRWLGSVSEAERQRMHLTLTNGAAAFAQDFDGELTRAYLLFQSDPLDSADPVARLTASFDQWRAASRHPRLIKDVYLFTPDAGSGELKRFDVATHALAPAEWPASMADWRTRLADATQSESGTTPKGNTVVIRRIATAIWDTVPAIVVPTPVLLLPRTPGATSPSLPARFSYSILVIDLEYVERELLPALADQHFKAAGESSFQIAVVSRAGGGRVIYHSSASFSPSPDAAVDARQELFSVRTQDFGRVAAELHRFTAFAATLRARGEAAGRAASGIVVRDQRPLSIFFQNDRNTGPNTQYQTSTVRLAPANASAWQLLLKHQAGSVEAAVGAVRRRNLFISSSILAVLGASMGLLVLSTRTAQKLARQQMEFVATVSHELRTPLAVIRSAAENLADGVIQDEAQIKKYGEVMRAEGRRLTTMVEQILEFAGIQSGQRALNPAPIPVAPLLRDVLSGPTMGSISVEIDVPDDLPAVLGDEPALRRVFQNLVDNAVKYGGRGSWIGVRARHDRGQVQITIADRGIGIAPADQTHIFEPFYRAPAVVAAQMQGAGLGLSLVQRIVLAHGGKTSVRSTPGQGSEFTVTLPAVRHTIHVLAPVRRGDAPRYT
jgi:signal transduction histidine kinase